MDALKGALGMKAAVAVNPFPPQWHSGICDCTQDTGICVQTFCCHLCTYTNIQNQRDMKIGAFDCCTFVAIAIGSYGTGNDLLGWMSFSFRRELVQRYGILEETICKSCMLGTCCGPCSICQVQREMAKRNEHCGGCCANPPPQAPSLADKAMNSLTAGVVGALSQGAVRQPHPWGSGLCGCGVAECCEGIFCPCCIMGFMATRLDAGKTIEKPHGVPNAMDPVTCCGALWYPQGHIYANRRELIERYNIIGETHTMTCINVLCCSVCALCQQRREMGYANEWPGGLLVKDPLPPSAPH